MLDAADILAPRGELEPTLFPLETSSALASRVRAWIDKGVALATAAGIADAAVLDAASEAYTYWKGYNAALQRILGSPVTNTINDKGTTAYSSEQLKMLAAERDRWEATWLTYVPDDVPDGDTPPQHQHDTGSTHAVWRF